MARAHDIEFPIGIIAPITSVSQDFLAASVAFDLDFRKNFNTSLRERLGEPIVHVPNLHPGLRIETYIGTSHSNPSVGIKTALDWIMGSNGFSAVSAIVGGFHSAVTAPISTITSAQQVPTVAWGASSPEFSDKTRHPYFLRTLPSDIFQGQAMWAWVGHFSVPSVAFVYTLEPYGEELFRVFRALAEAEDQPHRIYDVGLQYQASTFDLDRGREAFQNQQRSGSKFLILAMGAAEANALMLVMEMEGALSSHQILASESIQWLPSHPYSPTGGLPVGLAQFLPLPRGPLFTRFAELMAALTEDDLYSTEARERYKLHKWAVLPEHASVPMLSTADINNAAFTNVFVPYLFDAGYSLVLAINSLLNQGLSAEHIMGEVLLEELKKTTFEGVSSEVQFLTEAQGNGLLQLWNAQQMGNESTTRLHLIGSFNQSSAALTMLENPCWAGGNQSATPPRNLLACASNYYLDDRTQVCTPCPIGVGCGYIPEDGFPLGFFGPLTSLNQGYLAAAIAFDIDFRKNFDASLRERFGDPIVRIDNLNPALRIKLQIGTSHSDIATGMETVAHWVLGTSTSHVVGLVGGWHSTISGAISPIAAMFEVPQISWGATASSLSDIGSHPYFLRTVSADLAAVGMWFWMEYFGAPSVTFLYTDEVHGEGSFSTISSTAAWHGQASRVAGVAAHYIANRFSVEEVRLICGSIRNLRRRVVMMALATPAWATSMMYVMEEEGMLYNHFQFLGTDTFMYVPMNPLKPSAGMPIGLMRFEQKTQGPLFPSFVELWRAMAPDDLYSGDARDRYLLDMMAVLPEDADARMLEATDFAAADAATMDTYYAPLFDACYAFVVAINDLLNRGMAPSDIFGEVLLEELKQISFEGISGRVQLDSDGERVVEVSLLNWGPSDPDSTSHTALKEVEVAVFDTDSGAFRLRNGTSIYWVGGIASTSLLAELVSCEEGFELSPTLGYCTPCPNGWFSVGGSSNAALCQPCTIGRMSSASSASANCTACSRGTFSAEVGEVCTSCPVGTFGELEGQSACEPCEVGSYNDEVGQPQCVSCGAGKSSPDLWTSLSEVRVNGVTEWIFAVGSASEEACGCRHGARPDAAGECIPCTEGMTCRGMNLIEIDAGYFADTDLSVFRCHGESERCRGGVPGQTCAPGRTGLTCTDCREGLKPVDESGGCEDCNASDSWPFIATGAIGILCLILLYYLIDMQDRVAHRYAGLLVVIALSQLITMVQQVGVVGSLAVDWQSPAGPLMKQIGLLTFNISVLHLSCVGLGEAVTRYCAKVSLIFITIVVMLLIHSGFVAIRFGFRFKERRATLVASLGSIFSLFYISVASTVLEPLQCQEHPNKKWSMTNYPEILCWDSHEHTLMLVVGATAFVLVPLAYLVACILSVKELPRRVHKEDAVFLKMVSFLFFRFRADKRYYAIFQILRSLLFAMVLVIPDVAVQTLWLEILLLLGSLLSVALRPWRVASANAFDSVGSALLLMIVCIASLYIEEEDKDLTLLSEVCLVAILLLPLPAAFAMWRMLTFMVRRVKPFEFFLCHHKASAGAFSRLLKMCLQDSKRLKSEVFLDSDNLQNLGELFDHVGNDTMNLVVVATPQIFTRPWCVGEMCTARIRKVNTVLVAMPSLQLGQQRDIALEHIEQVEILIENDIDVQTIIDTFQWVAEISPIRMPAELSSKVLADLASLLIAGKPLPRNTILIEPSLRVETSPSAHVASILMCDVSNPEAIAAALVLQRMLSAHLAAMPTKIPVLLERLLPQSAQTAVYICTNGCFENARFLSFILQMSEFQNPPASVPVIAEATFQVPTREKLQSWTQTLPGSLPSEAPQQLAQVVSAIFKEIALVFQPHHDVGTVLVIRAKAIRQRLLAALDAATDGSPGRRGSAFLLALTPDPSNSARLPQLQQVSARSNNSRNPSKTSIQGPAADAMDQVVASSSVAGDARSPSTRDEPKLGPLTLLEF